MFQWFFLLLILSPLSATSHNDGSNQRFKPQQSSLAWVSYGSSLTTKTHYLLQKTKTTTSSPSVLLFQKSSKRSELHMSDMNGQENNSRRSRERKRRTNNDKKKKNSRRAFLSISTISLASSINAKDNGAAYAKGGLISFPCKDIRKFSNVYNFMRAGESLLEEENIWTTNPLFLTNREAALSKKGINQVYETCRKIKSNKDDIITVIKYSFAASSIDSSVIIGDELLIGVERRVPEFFFMDPRAIGNWDMSKKSEIEPAVWALDNDEAGIYGEGGRPPENEDSTPHETLSDQVSRLQQLLSALDTNYSGDSILLIFPDGTSPALLECLIGGIPLNRVHEFEYGPGEVRFDITYDKVQQQVSDFDRSITDTEEGKARQEEYSNVIERGRKKLRELRDNPDIVLNEKDLKYEKEFQLEQEKLLERQQIISVEEEKKKKQAQQKEQQKSKERRERVQTVQRREQEKKDSSSSSTENKSLSIPVSSSTSTSPVSIETTTTTTEISGTMFSGLAGAAAIIASTMNKGSDSDDPNTFVGEEQQKIKEEDEMSELDLVTNEEYPMSISNETASTDMKDSKSVDAEEDKSIDITSPFSGKSTLYDDNLAQVTSSNTNDEQNVANDENERDNNRLSEGLYPRRIEVAGLDPVVSIGGEKTTDDGDQEDPDLLIIQHDDGDDMEDEAYINLLSDLMEDDDEE